jgi:hypothetical protein
LLGLLLPLSAATLACNEAPLVAAPDAGNPCLAPVLEYACHPQAATLPGCGPDLDSGVALNREVMLDGGSYPSGCTVIVYSPVPDLDDQCSQLGTCNCTETGDGGPYNWVCVQ